MALIPPEREEKLTLRRWMQKLLTWTRFILPSPTVGKAESGLFPHPTKEMTPGARRILSDLEAEAARQRRVAG